MTSPRIIVFAYSDIGHACLKFLLDRGENVVCVYTHEDNPGENLWFPSVKQLAEERFIQVHTVEKLNNSKEKSFLEAYYPDLIFSFYYRNMIPSSILEIPRLGAYNMHGSFLPLYRGRAPVNWAVLNGESSTGATLHVMVTEPDAGDIIDQEPVPIGSDDSAAQVHSLVKDAALLVLARQLDNLKNGTALRHPQDPARATYFGRRRPEDSRIDWSWPARRIHNLVRASGHPYPGAFGDLFGEKIFIWKSALRSSRSDEDGLFVTCGDGKDIELVTVQPEGKAEMLGKQFKKQTVMEERKS